MPNVEENGKAVEAAYLAYEALKHSHYDVIHFQDRLGPAYYYLEARAQGLLAQPAAICVHVHHPTLHRLVTGQAVERGYALPAICFLERRSIESADFVYCLSENTHQALLELQLELDGKPAPVPPLEATLGRKTAGVMWSALRPRASAINEFLFVAPLNQHNGFTTFIYAIDAMLKRGVDNFKVSIYGAIDPAFDYQALLQKYADKWPIKLRDMASAPIALVQAKIRDSASIICMPGRADTRATFVNSALAAGRPFLSTRRESLSDTIDCEGYFVDAHHLAWADRMQEVLEQGIPLPQGRLEAPGENWWRAQCDLQASCSQALMADAARTPDFQPAADGSPMISVCIAHLNRPENITSVIAALRQQSFQDYEIVVVDDGSSAEQLQALRSALDGEAGVSLVEQENRYLGSARNTGARHARGRYLLFHDDDNIARPKELQTLFEVAERTEADVLCCFSDVFVGDGPPDESSIQPLRRMPIGADIYYGLVRNGFGDSNCLVRRSAWAEGGGFSEHYRIGLDDHEFFARMVLAGYRLLVVPESLYYYRLNETPMRNFHANRHADFVRVLDTYRDAGIIEPDMLPLLFAMRAAYRLR